MICHIGRNENKAVIIEVSLFIFACNASSLLPYYWYLSVANDL